MSSRARSLGCALALALGLSAVGGAPAGAADPHPLPTPKPEKASRSAGHSDGAALSSHSRGLLASAERAGRKRVTVMALTQPGKTAQVASRLKALGGTVTSEDFPEGNANFVSYINNAKSAGAGVIFAPVSTNYAQLIIEAASAQGFEGHLLGSDTWDNNMVIESAKGKSVNVEITTFYQEGGAPEFDSGIKAWMNENPDALTNNGGNDMVSAVTAMGYDAYFVALEAIKAAGSTDPAAVLAALPGVSYSGVSGLIEFDEIGDAKRDAAYIKTANTETGAWDFVKIQGID